MWHRKYCLKKLEKKQMHKAIELNINCNSNCLYFVKTDEVDCLIYFTYYQ